MSHFYMLLCIFFEKNARDVRVQGKKFKKKDIQIEQKQFFNNYSTIHAHTFSSYLLIIHQAYNLLIVIIIIIIILRYFTIFRFCKPRILSSYYNISQIWFKLYVCIFMSMKYYKTPIKM